MASLQRAQTGNRVYGGVGQSPNKGQVSARGAQGYIKREVKNRNQGGVVRPVGRDGKSDSRSGVASRALNNSLGNNTVRGQATGKGPKQRGQGSKLPNAQPNSNVQAAPVGAQPTAPVVPQVRVNDKGLLELPYSQNMSLSALGALEGSNEELLALQMEEQQMAATAAQQRRDTDLQYGQLKTQELAGQASGGTAYSSMYGKAVSDNATAYSNTLGEIQRQESDFTQQASARRAAIQSALSQQLAQDAQDNAVDLSDDAGTLGYGNYTAPINNHGPAKHPNRHTGGKGNNGGRQPAKKDPPKAKSGGGPVKKGKK